MALIKRLPTSFGPDARYHRVVQVNLDAASAGGRIVVASYLDQAAREAGKEPLDRRGYALSKKDHAELVETGPEPGAPFSHAYAWIKAGTGEGRRCEAFAGADDV